MPKQNVRIYHHPRCSKSRATLELLLERGIAPEVVEYLKTPPSAGEVKALVRKLRLPPHELLRSKEAPYGELGLSSGSSLDEIAQAIAHAPILMERPVVVVGERAVIGRPPDRVLALL